MFAAKELEDTFTSRFTELLLSVDLTVLLMLLPFLFVASLESLRFEQFITVVSKIFGINSTSFEFVHS